MKTITLNVPDNRLDEILNSLKQFNDVEIYEDREVVADFWDKLAHKKALKELKKGKSKDWKDLKKELDLV